MEQSEKQFPSGKWIAFNFMGWLSGIALILLLSKLFEKAGLESFRFFIGFGMASGMSIFQWLVLRKVFPVNPGWIWWSILAMGLPFLVNDALSAFFNISLDENYLPVSIACGVLLLSYFQYSVLNDHYNDVGKWIPVSTAAWLLAAAMLIAIKYTMQMEGNDWLLLSLNVFLILSGGPLVGWLTGLKMKKIVSSK